MIYFDVTSTCKSGINTGIQRMTRQLFRHLSPALPVTPLQWSPQSYSYAHLGSPELQNLDERNAGRTARSSPLLRTLRQWWHRLDLLKATGKGDLLFIPEVFQDLRIEFLDSIAARSLKKIAVFHDAIAWKHPEWTAPERRPRFLDYLRALSRFQHIVCVSREAEVHLHSFWQSEKLREPATTVLHWPTEFLTALPFPESNFGSKNILVVSTLEQRKNHLTLLAAAEKLWERKEAFSLTLIGNTCPDWTPRIEAKIATLKAGGHSIEWLHHVDDSTLHTAYRQSSFTVYPSLAEGFGLPILESLRHGRPCICGTTGALGEVSQGGGCFGIDQTQPDLMADAIHQLLTNETLYNSLVREAAQHPFGTWKDYIPKLIPLLQ